MLIIALATLLLGVVTLLPFSRHPHWLIRGADFPRLQFALMAIALLLAQLMFLDSSATGTRLLMGVTALCLGYQLWWILPYTPLWPQEVQTARNRCAERQLSILTSNVLTPNRNAAALLALVNQHQPDVLVTLESDQWWQEQLAELESVMPYTIQCPLDNLYGMHVYSRLPLADTEIAFLVEDDVPSMHARLSLRSGDSVRMHFLHPAPPSPTENPESTERDAELVMVARSIANSDQPVILTGDLNDVAWSPTTRLFRKISGLLDPRIGRGMFNTFNAKYPFLRWPLDHLFHSEHFTVESIQRLPPIGSDHFALLTCLLYTPVAGLKQSGLSANSEDRSWAQSIVDDQSVSKADVPEPGE
ncbi:endonuclease/exonuclease/phosphatase family protein [Pseudomaricurvus hydrocarbonicus]|uniref:endonuclease/exonuclease/phosphatase family protein n=1 Tax=Pseudomaricurvus hydrocarbonicus TaxID=1470433 RepID=UPI00312C83A9